jgi:UDP-N-acetyl-D-mannosaminuronate dehydrogenase
VKELVINSLNKAGVPLSGTRIAILGVSYKANVRDVQISPSIKVIKLLKGLNADLAIYDPYYKGEDINGFSLEKSLDDALNGATAIAVLTDHDEFKQLDFKAIGAKNGRLVIIDSRNIYNLDQFPKGTIYCGVGRPLQTM